MPRARPTHRLLGALALCALAPGCSRQEPPGAEPGAGAAAEGLSSPRAGVKVPLPAGWTALVAADGSFQAGPPGRPALRVDMRRGEGAKMPTAQALALSVPQHFSQFEVSVEQQEGHAGLALVRLSLAPRQADGGVGPSAPALLGARRVGEDLFLCATLPGATAEEVRLATEACRDIQVQPAPR